ncbi:glycosyltransferase involved in cell wall biosynthesis [Alkalibacillus almallahensis]|nr:glycosyltransferase involved in cell wall biosynthesis [Alkalibacillus almallahensis]
MTTVHHPFDPRIYHKECKSLYESGYDVVLLAPSTGENEDILVPHVPIKHYSSKLKRMILGSIEVYKKAKKLKADVYHFHDPELIFVARLLKRRNNTVVYDVHEDFLTSLVKKDYLNKFVKKIIKYSFRSIEKIFTKGFEFILAEKYYQNIYPKGKWILNYPTVNQQYIEHQRKDKPIEKRLLYTGNVDIQRGAQIHAKIPDLHSEIGVHFVGKCPLKFAEEIYRIAGDTKERIHITGINKFIEKEEIDRQYLSRNWLAGLAIFPPTDHYQKKELTKFFEYMNAGIPIICSNFSAWKEFVNKHQCGIAVDPYDDDEIRDTIDYLVSNPSKVHEMGLNGKKAVISELNWQSQANRLVELYDDWTKTQ